MKLRFALIALLVLAMFAQGVPRPVALSWTLSSPTGVTGVQISTGSSASGPWKFLVCWGTVTGQTCQSGSPQTTLAYTDTETSGSLVFYQWIASAAPCTNTTPLTTVCGTGNPTVASTTIPPPPGFSAVSIVVP
jgi:hypothetical protein